MAADWRCADCCVVTPGTREATILSPSTSNTAATFMTANLRFLLLGVLGMALLANYQMWVHDYPAAPPVTTIQGPGTSAPSLDSTTPTANAPPSAAAAGAAPVVVAPTAGTATLSDSASAHPSAGQVHVHTDVLDVQVSLAGGELERVDLPAYPAAKNTPDVPVRILNRDSADSLFVLQSGLAGANGESAPTHQAIFTADTKELVLGPEQSELSLPLHWSDGHGVTVTKTLIFHRGEYAIGLDYQVHNAGSTAWSFAPYEQILRYNTPIER